MTRRIVAGLERLGAIETPQRNHVGVFNACQLRPKWAIQEKMPLEAIEQFGGLSNALRAYQIDPALMETEVIWASVTHNGRPNMGASMVSFRLFGLALPGAANTTAAVFLNMGLGTSAQVAAVATDLSISSVTGGVSTNEWTTNGLARALSAAGNGVAPASVNAIFSVDATKTYTVTAGTNQVVNGAALFDSVTVAGSNMYVEDLFGVAASVSNTDQLAVTYTVQQ